MDKETKDLIARFICYGLGCLIAYYVLLAVLPYAALFFALYAFGWLMLRNGKNNRRRN